jgi:hypothetical protein
MTRLPSEISDVLMSLDEDQLRQLYMIVGERLHLFQKAKQLRNMANFNIGDLVSFEHSDGRAIQGVITKLNQKTISLLTNQQQKWNVSPSLLRKIGSAHS